jgi:hypothetical protein
MFRGSVARETHVMNYIAAWSSQAVARSTLCASDWIDFGLPARISLDLSIGRLPRPSQTVMSRALHIARNDCTQQIACSRRPRAENSQTGLRNWENALEGPSLPCSFTRMGFPPHVWDAEQTPLENIDGLRPPAHAADARDAGAIAGPRRAVTKTGRF